MKRLFIFIILLISCSIPSWFAHAQSGPGSQPQHVGPSPYDHFLYMPVVVTAYQEQDWKWDLPSSFPRPYVPDDNPMSYAKVELGRHLFYDTRLSGNGTQSCASCHRQDIAFTDDLAQAIGSTGEVHPRNSQTLTNAGYNATLTWANPALTRIEQQVLIPLFGEFPHELGVTGHENEVMARLKNDSNYQTLFARAFPKQTDPFQWDNITRALASFTRTLISSNSPYDRYTYLGDTAAMSAAALRGQALFFSERLSCDHCHGGFNFSGATRHGSTVVETTFENNGLYNIDGQGGYPIGNRGLFEITGKASDMGRFRPPTLRNSMFTAPYMHDGSIANIEDVIRMYAAGGRNITSGEHSGDGRLNPYKSGLVSGFTLTDQEFADLIAFLDSLTDTTFIRDKRISNPFPEP